MSRMSDILKKINNNGTDAVAKPDSQAKSTVDNAMKYAAPKANKAKSAVVKAVSEELKQKTSFKEKLSTKAQSSMDNENVCYFTKLCDLAENLFLKSEAVNFNVLLPELKSCLNCLNTVLRNNPNELLREAYLINTYDSNYLIAHSVSSVIYTLKLCIGLDLSAEKVIDAAIAAFFHDIGMKDYLNLVNKAEALSESEYDMQKFHVIKAAEILSEQEEISDDVIKAIKEHHERYDGSGYPDKLKRSKISEIGQILSIVDVYTALIHKRIYRERFNAIDAIEIIIEHKEAFSYRLIKKLIESIGLFPIGSMIELNTGEKAEIVAINSIIPLRPKIKILYNAEGEEIDNSKLFDLQKHQTLYIERAL